MIEWGEKGFDHQLSKQPRGYTVYVSMYGERQHVGAWFNHNGNPVLVAEVRNVDRHDIAARKKAAQDVRAACVQHYLENKVWVDESSPASAPDRSAR